MMSPHSIYFLFGSHFIPVYKPNAKLTVVSFSLPSFQALRHSNHICFLSPAYVPGIPLLVQHIDCHLHSLKSIDE